jgi:hypothetical protein
MSKKKRSRETEKKKLPVFPIVVAVLIVAGLFVVIANPFDKQGTNSQTRSFLVLGGETRPVVDPGQFTGMTREAYAAAKAVPEVLDKVYCYCYCDDPPFNHKSLLSCFVDYHGAS